MNQNEIYESVKSFASKINEKDVSKAKIVLCYTGGHEIIYKHEVIYKLDEFAEKPVEKNLVEKRMTRTDQTYGPTRRRRYDDEEDED